MADPGGGGGGVGYSGESLFGGQLHYWNGLLEWTTIYMAAYFPFLA